MDAEEMGQTSYTFKLNPQQVTEARHVLGEDPEPAVQQSDLGHPR